jgi:hypothetical protein
MEEKVMRIKGIYGLIIGLVMLLGAPLSSVAYDLPSVNLGFTSFLDGAPPSGPGLYIQEYLQYWQSDDFKDIPLEGEELEAWINLNQITYQSNTEFILGAKWGLDIIVPLVKLDTNFTMENDGLGDIWVGPYLQWDPIMGENGPKLLHRFSLGFIFPTGDYDVSKGLNAGSNFFSFNPYWAATYFITPKWEVSTRVSYLLNEENDDHGIASSEGSIDEVQAGEAFHINFASSYELIPQQFRIGINGYYLRQLSETEYDGVEQTGTKEKVLAIGPGMLYSFNKDAHLFINMYFESNAENRPEGERYNARFVYHF